MRIVLMMPVALSMAMAEPTTVKAPKTNRIWEDCSSTVPEKSNESYGKSGHFVRDIK